MNGERETNSLCIDIDANEGEVYSWKDRNLWDILMYLTMLMKSVLLELEKRNEQLD